MNDRSRTIAIACSSPTEKSEPFIEHIKQRIKGEKYFLYGDNLPKFAVGVGPLSYYPGFIYSQIRKTCKKFGINYDSPLVEGIKRFLKEKKIQIVLSEFGSTGAKMAPICKELGLPHIVHFHGGGDVDSKLNIKNFREEYLFMFEHASAVIGVSEDMKFDLNKIGCDFSKINIIPYGPDDVFSKITPDFQYPTFLFIGRFVDQKAPYYLLEAFRKVLQQIPNAKLLMIGDGPLLNTCKNLARLWTMNDYVNFVGYLDHKLLPEYLMKAFCYVQHSIVAEDGCSEGTPVSILEASLAGLPIVSTFHKGIKQAVIHSETGYLVEEHDVNRMSEYMVELANNLDMAKTMGDKGRYHIKKCYSMQKYIDSLDSLIGKFI